MKWVLCLLPLRFKHFDHIAHQPDAFLLREPLLGISRILRPATLKAYCTAIAKQLQPLETDSVHVSATITDDSPFGAGSNALVLQWGFSSYYLPYTISLAHLSGNKYQTSYAISPQDKGKRIYYAIQAADCKGNIRVSNTYSYLVDGSEPAPEDTVDFRFRFDDNAKYQSVGIAPGTEKSIDRLLIVCLNKTRSRHHEELSNNKYRLKFLRGPILIRPQDKVV